MLSFYKVLWGTLWHVRWIENNSWSGVRIQRFNPGLLALGNINIFVHTNLSCRGCSMHCMMFNSILTSAHWMPIMWFPCGDSPKSPHIPKGPLEAKLALIVNHCFTLMLTIYVILMNSLYLSEVSDPHCRTGVTSVSHTINLSSSSVKLKEMTCIEGL